MTACGGNGGKDAKIEELEAQVEALKAQVEGLSEELVSEIGKSAIKELGELGKVAIKGENEKKEAKGEPKPIENTSGMTKEEAFESQKVIVKSVKRIEQTDDINRKSLYPDMVSVVIENISEDVVKGYTISVLAYDEKGYPVKVEGRYDFNPDYELKASEEAANIQPNETYGEDKGVNLDKDSKVFYAIAVIKEVEFYDSGTWENPYYSYFIEEFKEKPQDIELLNNFYK